MLRPDRYGCLLSLGQNLLIRAATVIKGLEVESAQIGGYEPVRGMPYLGIGTATMHQAA
jgi:hypothetical protein